MPTVSAVLVAFGSPAATVRAVESLREQSVAPEEIIVVDNHPVDRVGEIAGASVVRLGENLGYAAGANAGVRRSSGDWVLLLNPDATAEPDCIERLLEAADAATGIVGAQVLLPDGRVNAGDNPLHITGISWSGRYLERAEYGPPRSVAVVSGAALMIRRAAWTAIGGLAEPFFLYQDDVDLAWRARLAGWDVRFAPAARVRHDYTFDKGREKWFWLERNRFWTILSNYEARTLLLLAPVLLAAEAAVIAQAVAGGWWHEKLRAAVAVGRSAGYIARRRREVRRSRRSGDGAILAYMTSEFETPLATSAAARRAGPVLERYRRLLARRLA